MALLFVGCARIVERGPTVEVELDAFSGRPNPQWQLSPERTADLLSKISSLPEAKAAPPEPGLGYRGFLLSEGGRSIRVYMGTVEIKENEATRLRTDTANIERDLATDAKQRGFGSVVKEILAKP
jgi:hypothetical protein